MGKDNKSLRNVLITGGAGFIGSKLALKLVDKGYNVTVLDILTPQIHGDNPDKKSPLYISIKDKVKFMKGSVCTRNDIELAIQGQHAIIHLAAETGTGQSMYEIEKYVNTNIGSTALILDILTNSRHEVSKFLIASSRAVYGEGKYICKEHGEVFPSTREDKDMQDGNFECKCPICAKPIDLTPTTEESKLHPTSVYGISKQTQEQLVMAVCPTINIAPVVFRYQNVYGAGQSLTNPYTGILSIFSTRIKNGNPITIFEDGQESRDFVYIDDVVDATIIGLENEKAKNQVFNVGTGVNINVETVTKLLIKKYQSKIEYTITGNYRLGDIRHNFADISKMKALGFLPKYDFEKGMQKFVEWVNIQETNIDKFDDSIVEMKAKGLFK